MQRAFEYAFFFVVNDINMMLSAGVNMEQEFIENSVRTRLILSGMSEIEKHGVNDFSLRRVALAAQVSCAAPYRHFKDKEELTRIFREGDLRAERVARKTYFKAMKKVGFVL